MKKCITLLLTCVCFLFFQGCNKVYASPSPGLFIIVVEETPDDGCNYAQTTINIRERLTDEEAESLKKLLYEVDGVVDVITDTYSVAIARGTAFTKDEVVTGVLWKLHAFLKTRIGNREVIILSKELHDKKALEKFIASSVQ